MENNNNELAVGDVVGLNFKRTIDFLKDHDESYIKMLYDTKSLLSDYELDSLPDETLNDILNIVYGCFDSVEYLDEFGTRRAYDYWLIEWHEKENEYRNLLDKVLNAITLDEQILELMKKSNGFIILDSLIEDNPDDIIRILKDNSQPNHSSFVIDDVEKRFKQS